MKLDSSVLVKKSGSYFSNKNEDDGHYGFDDSPARLQTGFHHTVKASISGSTSWFGEHGKARV